MSTVGEEFKEATLANLLRVARIALERHHFLEAHTIQSVEDVAAFDHDLLQLQQTVRDIEVDVKKTHRWYRDGGREIELTDPS